MPELGGPTTLSGSMALTTAELRFFRRNGYLIKRKVMDPDLMAEARRRLWDDPPPSMQPDDPRTWVGPLPEADLSPDLDNHRGEYRWQYRLIGSEPWIVRMLATDPAIFAMAEQMLGPGELQTPDRIRGIYCTLPFGERPRPPVGCHCDGHPFHLGVVGYIDDVAADGGGFCVWPGSHRRFYHTFTTGYQSDTTPAQEDVRDQVNRDPPVDLLRRGRGHRLLAPPPGPHGGPQLLRQYPSGRALRLPQAGPGRGAGPAAVLGHVAALVAGAARGLNLSDPLVSRFTPLLT